MVYTVFASWNVDVASRHLQARRTVFGIKISKISLKILYLTGSAILLIINKKIIPIYISSRPIVHVLMCL